MKSNSLFLSLAILTAAAQPLPAHAACPQELAVYADAESGLGLEFRSLAQETTVTANAFRVIFPDTGLALEGNVIWNQGVSRPNGIVLHDCPEGDATGEEIDACTVWSGVVYTIDNKGTVGFLPPEGESAAEKILLPDFGRAVRYSTLYGDKTALIPWDVFKLSGCQE